MLIVVSCDTVRGHMMFRNNILHPSSGWSTVMRNQVIYVYTGCKGCCHPYPPEGGNGGWSKPIAKKILERFFQDQNNAFAIKGPDLLFRWFRSFLFYGTLINVHRRVHKSLHLELILSKLSPTKNSKLTVRNFHFNIILPFALFHSGLFHWRFFSSRIFSPFFLSHMLDKWFASASLHQLIISPYNAYNTK